jgi:hypothetical protein
VKFVEVLEVECEETEDSKPVTYILPPPRKLAGYSCQWPLVMSKQPIRLSPIRLSPTRLNLSRFSKTV